MTDRPTLTEALAAKHDPSAVKPHRTSGIYADAFDLARDVRQRAEYADKHPGYLDTLDPVRRAEVERYRTARAVRDSRADDHQNDDQNGDDE